MNFNIKASSVTCCHTIIYTIFQSTSCMNAMIPNTQVQPLDIFLVKPLTQGTVIALHRFCTILFHL